MSGNKGGGEGCGCLILIIILILFTILCITSMDVDIEDIFSSKDTNIHVATTQNEDEDTDESSDKEEKPTSNEEIKEVKTAIELSDNGYPKKNASKRNKALDLMYNGTDDPYYVKWKWGKLVKCSEDDSSIEYYGDFKKNMPHGLGLVIFNSGDSIFIGDFDKGKPSGWGMMFEDTYSSDGYIAYEGNDSGVLLNTLYVSGKGYKYSFDEALNPIVTYKGELDKVGQSHGKGTAYFTSTVNGSISVLYSGEFKNDLYEGKGKFYSPDGDLLYSGEFDYGEPEDGSVVVGINALDRSYVVSYDDYYEKITFTPDGEYIVSNSDNEERYRGYYELSKGKLEGDYFGDDDSFRYNVYNDTVYGWDIIGDWVVYYPEE